jgi:hypothetical protein
VVNGVRVTRCRRPRVYTTWTACLLGLLAVLVAPVRAQKVTVASGDPVMIKGPASAPVTIVEFSDYQ